MTVVADGTPAAVAATPVKDKRRMNKAKTKTTTNGALLTTTLASPPGNEPSVQAPQPMAYVQRLNLTGRCVGETSVTRTPIDLSDILSDASALRAMGDDLFRAFRQSSVDLIVAVHEDQQQHQLQSPSAERHNFTSAIAGVMAGRHGTALGQLSVYHAKAPQEKAKVVVASAPPAMRTRKRGRAAAATATAAVASVPPVVAPVPPAAPVVCQRVVYYHHAATGLSVEWRRELLALGSSSSSSSTGYGTRVLLVSDWIDGVDALLAARDALLSHGVDVVGVSVVVATNARLMEQLSARQIPWSCAWTPTSGAQLTVKSSVPSKECQCEATTATTTVATKSTKPLEDHDLEFQYVTSQYEANAPSEDRSVNAVKPTEPGIRLYAVFDGHGGTVAVEHLKATLCREIFTRVSSESTEDEVEEALKQAFAVCDDALKRYLESLSPTVRMSKGYCNTGSCAVVALIVGATLYVANVGDCAAVLGRQSPISDRVWARELSVEHNCRNATEVKLVMERSRDRHAIRLSKDDQESENSYGVKRVAGSLAVTRAFGDFYLKCEELSTAPFKSKVPYITVEPSVSKHKLWHDGDEEFAEQVLILASDGLWEVVGCEEAVGMVARFALEKVAHRDGMLFHELLALPRGRERRRFHDDITCTVIRIKSPSTRPRLASAETVDDNETTDAALRATSTDAEGQLANDSPSMVL